MTKLAYALFCLLVICSPQIFLWLSSFSPQLHWLCLSAIPAQEVHSPHTAAIVCGASWKAEHLKNQFIDMGLIHLIVVSGGHLWLWLRWTRTPSRTAGLLFIFLILFCLVTRMQAPVVRASAQVLLSVLSVRQKLFWRRDQQIFIAGAVSWWLMPDSTQSLSLMLSWVASLALCLGRDRLWVQCLWAYVFLFPLTMMLGANSPLSVAFNALFSPLLSFLLYPLSLASLIAHPLSTPLNLTWQAIETALAFLAPHIPQRSLPLQMDARWGWGYIAFLHVGFLVFAFRNDTAEVRSCTFSS